MERLLGKDEVRAFKGYAILMMLWLHLFNSRWYCNTEDVFFYLTKFGNLCVPIYVFLSGFGLVRSGKNTMRDSFRRILNLYKIYLPIFILSSIVYFGVLNIKFDLFEYSLNLLNIAYSYNQSYWFFPMYYSLLLIYPLLYKYHKYTTIIILICLILKLIGKFFLSHYTFMCPIDIPDILLAILNSLSVYLIVFYIGMFCSTWCFYDKYVRYIRTKSPSSIVVRVVILISIIGITLFIPYYGIANFILIPILLPIFPVNRITSLFGRYSTLIWLFHFVFLYALGETIFSIHNPLAIYVLFSLAMLLWAIFYLKAKQILSAKANMYIAKILKIENYKNRNI